MSAFKIILQTAGPHPVDDLGFSLNGDVGTIIDMVAEDAQHVSTSESLQELVANGDILVLDPRDPTEATILDQQTSAAVIANHNQITWGIVGGRFAALDNPTNAPVANGVVTIGTTAGSDAIVMPLNELMSNGDNLEAIQDIVGDLFDTDSNITYTDDPVPSLTLEDNFLLNTGDTLDSGVLNVASGASISINSGADLTIADSPVDPKDAVNKEYVDALASGLDHKDSVQAATVADLGFSYTNNGGVGDTLTFTGDLIVDGITLEVNNRLLVKDQTDPTQNGIYVLTTSGELTRAEDHNGDQGNEVSGGNSTFVESGNTNGATGWILTGLGDLVVNTDDIIWTQNSGQGTYSAFNGINLTGTDFTLDVDSLTPETIELTDAIAFADISDPSAITRKITAQNLLSDLNIVTSDAVGGFSVQTSQDIYENRSFEVDVDGPLNGLVVSNGDGITGNPTFGLDIQNLPALNSVSVNDRIAVWDSVTNANVYYTVANIVSAVSATDSFKTWNVGGNFVGDSTLVATSATDSITLFGGVGVEINSDTTTNVVEFRIADVGLVDTAIDTTDSLMLFDASNGSAPIKRTLADILNDLDIITEVTSSTLPEELGIAITDGDGVDGQPVIGLDIDGLPAATTDLAPTDKVALFDGTTNTSKTGEQFADGVATMLGLDGLMLSTINGQQILTAIDSVRGDKILSTDSNQFAWSEAVISNNDWVRIGTISDADSGYIAPLDGTVVIGTGHCENASGNSKDFHLFVNNNDMGSIGTLSGTSNVTFVDSTLNLDFNQGDRIRLFARDASGSGNIQDTVIALHVRWRA